MTNGTWRKSSYSSGGDTNCVEVGSTWRKSSYSGGATGSCVEIGAHGSVLVRDTKQAHLGDRRTVISFTPEAWQAFTKTLR